jgi:hypothetical protein
LWLDKANRMKINLVTWQSTSDENKTCDLTKQIKWYPMCFVKSQDLFSFDLLCQVTSFIFIRCALSSHKIYFHLICFVKSQVLFSFDLLCQVTSFIFIRCALSSHKFYFMKIKLVTWHSKSNENKTCDLTKHIGWK